MEFTRRFRVVALTAIVAAAAAFAVWAVVRKDAVSPTESAPLLGGERIIVEVLNGSGRRGLARAASRALRDAGFDVVYFGTVTDSLRTTQVLARRGDSSAAVKVARALGAGVALLKSDTLLRVDVSVLLGADYRPPPGFRP